MSYFSCLLHKDSFGFFFISVSVASISVAQFWAGGGILLREPHFLMYPINTDTDTIY